MNNYANHGYVVLAAKLVNMLPDNKQAKFASLLGASEPHGDCLEELQEFFDENTTYDPRAEFFVLDNDAESIDLEKGKVYAQFDEADLFEMTPSKFMLALNKIGIEPESRQWVTWG